MTEQYCDRCGTLVVLSLKPHTIEDCVTTLEMRINGVETNYRKLEERFRVIEALLKQGHFIRP